MAVSEMNYLSGGGGGKVAYGTETVASNSVATIDCGFKPTQIVIGYIDANSNMGYGVVYDEDYSTTKYRYTQTKAWQDYNIQSSSNIPEPPNSNGFKFKNVSSYSCVMYYMAKG